MDLLISFYESFTLITPEGSKYTCHLKGIIGQSKFEVHRVELKGKVFACKFFKPQDKQFFENESHFSFLHHPNILTPITFGLCIFEEDIQKIWAILYEYQSRGTLYDLLRSINSRLPERVVRYFFRQLVDAVEYMHEFGTAHLDIKPENIFLDDVGNVKLGDFDLSFSEDSGNLSRGSRNYRAPEMIDDEIFCPYSADMYSLGITLFAMHNGRQLPFTEDCEDYYGLFKYNEELYYEYLKKYRLNESENLWSNEFRDLFRALVEKNPNLRWNIKEIKRSEWYNQEICTKEEIAGLMN